MKKLIIFTQDEVEKLYNDEPVEDVVDGIEFVFMSDYRYHEYLKRGDDKMGWIHVRVQTPSKDGKYLVAIKEGDNWRITTLNFRVNGYSWGHWDRNTGGVRYWMPLPEPPRIPRREYK